MALPYALRMTGWFGLVLLFAFGIIMAYSALAIGKNRSKFTLENFSDHIEVLVIYCGAVYTVLTLLLVLNAVLLYSLLFPLKSE